MKTVFPPEWRTQTRWKRRFYARYMKWLERAGYVLVAGVFAAFVAAFNVKVEDVVSADKVAIVPFARPLVAKGAVRVVRVLAKDLDEVAASQPLLEVVVGDDAIQRYARWEAARGLPDEPGLLARYPKPVLTVLKAPVEGTFRLDAKEGATVEDETTLGRVVDYEDLRVEASLTGDTVARARPDAEARIVKIVVEPMAGTLFRGGGGVSGQALGTEVRAVVEKGLVGRGIRLRDDVPLRVGEVKEVQVDADVALDARRSWNRAARLDPPADLEVAAEVIEGAPSATVQVADLPPEVAADAERAVVQALGERGVRTPENSVGVLRGAKARIVVKLKAGPTDGLRKDERPIPGTMLSRSYDAKLRLIGIAPTLYQAVRQADRDGRTVTCRVELKTGERPAALRLLRKS